MMRRQLFRWALPLALVSPSLAVSQPCPANSADCVAATREARDTQRLAADEMLRAADGARGERARVGYRNAGRGYLLIWQTYHADPCRSADANACARGDEVLFSASRAFRAAHDFERSSEVNATLLDPQFSLHKTALATTTLREEGAVQQALTEYAKAATFYERFAQAAPKDEHAPDALLDAVVLRLALHDQDAAERNAEQWTKLYARKWPANHPKVIVAIAEGKRDTGASPRDLERYLSSNRPIVARQQSEYQPVIDMMLGTAVAARGDLANARPHFARAAAFDVRPLIGRLSADDQATADRRLAKALVGIADAQLWLADQARDAAMKLSIRKSDAESLNKKRAAIAEAEKEYTKVLLIQPMPPPIATVEAAARVARLRGRLWAQAHLAFGPDTAELMLAEAKAAYRNCVALGVKYQAQTPASAACAKWLERHFPKEHPTSHELMPQPRWSGARFTMPAALDDTGEEVVVTPE